MYGDGGDGGASLAAQFGTNILFQKCQKLLFLTPFGALPKIGGLDLKVCGERTWLPISKMV